MQRYGMTIPFHGTPLHQHPPLLEALSELGYTDLWSGEADQDGFTPLVQAALCAPRARVGSAIIPAFTRGPATLAMCAASLADVAPGRAVLGIGSSSNVIVEHWNDIPFRKPWARTRDTLRFLRKALRGERVDEEYETFRVRGFRLSRVPETPPKIMLAALRSRMLKLAGEESDGAILNWLSADDVKRVTPIVHEGNPECEIVCRVFVAPGESREKTRPLAKRLTAAYLQVPVYAEFHRWLGRGEALAEFWELWNKGERRAALEAMPDSVCDDLVIQGTPEECKAHIQRYVDAGVHTPVLQLVSPDPLETARTLAPGA